MHIKPALYKMVRFSVFHMLSMSADVILYILSPDEHRRHTGPAMDVLKRTGYSIGCVAQLDFQSSPLLT